MECLAQRIHGFEPGGFGGTFDDFAATIHADDQERVANEITEVVEHGTSYKVSYKYVRVDGSTGWIEGQGRVFRDRDGQAVRLLGVAHDVTSRIRERLRLDQLRRLASRLARARTTKRVLEVVCEELDETDVLVDFGSGDRPQRADAQRSRTWSDPIDSSSSSAERAASRSPIAKRSPSAS